jgi:hypothetical protein
MASRGAAAGLGVVGVAGEQGDHVVGVGQPPQRHRPQLVPGHIVREVGDQVAADGQGVGDPVHGGVQPHRVGRHHRSDHGPQPGLVGRGHRHIPPPPPRLPLSPRGVGVGLQHLGLRDPQHPSGHLVHRVGHRGIDHGGRLGVQPAGQRRHPPRHPHLTGTLEHRGVQRR